MTKKKKQEKLGNENKLIVNDRSVQNKDCRLGIKCRVTEKTVDF